MKRIEEMPIQDSSGYLGNLWEMTAQCSRRKSGIIMPQWELSCETGRVFSWPLLIYRHDRWNYCFASMMRIGRDASSLVPGWARASVILCPFWSVMSRFSNSRKRIHEAPEHPCAWKAELIAQYVLAPEVPLDDGALGGRIASFKLALFSKEIKFWETIGVLLSGL